MHYFSPGLIATHYGIREEPPLPRSLQTPSRRGCPTRAPFARVGGNALDPAPPPRHQSFTLSRQLPDTPVSPPTYIDLPETSQANPKGNRWNVYQTKVFRNSSPPLRRPQFRNRATHSSQGQPKRRSRKHHR